MLYRVSFYRESEIVEGRAPRYMVDLEAKSVDAAAAMVKRGDEDVIIRSVYKPAAPIPDKISYVFVTPEARNSWYNHKTKARLCHDCHKVQVDRYKRICASCLQKRGTKPCALCGKDIKIPNRHLYCDECQLVHKKAQEKIHRERRAKRKTIKRLKEQLKWAKRVLKTTSLSTCNFARVYQGARLPHAQKGAIRCRFCLQKFIDVQTGYLNTLKER